MRPKIITAAVLCLLQVSECASLWKDTTPQTPQPYALEKGRGILLGSGETWNTFPVTGNSSGKAFALMNTNGPGTPGEGVFPHVHKKTYENFYSAKGRIQLWGQDLTGYLSNTSIQTTRILSPGDFGGIPNGTIHTFRLLEPDTQLTGVLVPGGFEEFFFAMAGPVSNGSTGSFNLTELPAWDVYPQHDFSPRSDVVNGKAGPGNWYDGPNPLPEQDKNPIWIAKNHGPKWLNDEIGFYQIVAPLVRGQQSGGLFSQGHITMSPLQNRENGTVPKMISERATAFMVEEGELIVHVDGFDEARLIGGDVVFLPEGTRYAYFAAAEFTKVMYVSGGGNRESGLDEMLIQGGRDWSSAFYPRSGGAGERKRGIKI